MSLVVAQRALEMKGTPTLQSFAKRTPEQAVDIETFRVPVRLFSRKGPVSDRARCRAVLTRLHSWCERHQTCFVLFFHCTHRGRLLSLSTHRLPFSFASYAENGNSRNANGYCSGMFYYLIPLSRACMCVLLSVRPHNPDSQPRLTSVFT